MRYALCLLIVAILSFASFSPALAQDFADPLCDPAYFLDAYVVQLFNAQDVTQFTDTLNTAVITALDCGDDWLNMALTLILGGEVPGGDVAVPFNPDDGVLTAPEAEYAIESIATGDFATLNSYLCPSEQAEPTEFEGLEDFELTVDAICTEEMPNMRCSFTMTVNVDGVEEAFTEEALFAVEDGKLCTEIEE